MATYSGNAGKENKALSEHKLILQARKTGIITGVTDVEEFDNNTIILNTSEGRLLIKGRELKVKGLNLATGEAQIEGAVDSLLYTSKKSSESLLKRLFA